jgi:hypothetical protein
MPAHMPSERRKNPRLGLAIPLRIQGFLPDRGTWEEFSTTTDVSAGGACFQLVHDVELGQVLLLSLALPKRLRQYDLNDVTYRVYALVRGVRRRADRPRVGVMFFGKYPPRGFEERPAARYLLPSDPAAGADVPPALREGLTPNEGTAPVWTTSTAVGREADAGAGVGVAPRGADSGTDARDAVGTSVRPRAGIPPAPVPGSPTAAFTPSSDVPADRRGTTRYELFVNFTIQLVDEWGAVLQEELTVADNVSRGGARVMTSMAFRIGDVVLLQEAGGGFATRAEIRGITRVQTAVDRLHLRFVDRQAPDRLLRQ